MLCSGMVGAAFVILIIVFIGFIYPGYRISNYYVNEDPSALTELLSVELTSSDSTAVSRAILEETAKKKGTVRRFVGTEGYSIFGCIRIKSGRLLQHPDSRAFRHTYYYQPRGILLMAKQRECVIGTKEKRNG